MQKLNVLALSYSTALVSALVMLLLGVLANLGLYTGAVEMMQQWHLLFSPSVVGIIGGMIEATIISFVLTYLVGYTYNKLAWSD
jgi:putative effector of murein hydrolase LrgA (UPF0299 family)